MRERSKDIHALLTDPARLEEARRTKSLPPREDRGASFRITTPPQSGLDSRADFSSQQQPNQQSSLHASIESSRRSSFEHLQACDEETALKLAMAASAEEFEQSNTLMIEDCQE